MYHSNSKITVRRGTDVTRLDGKHVFESTTLVDPDGGRSRIALALAKVSDARAVVRRRRAPNGSSSAARIRAASDPS
jgi:hypothetical protein